MATRAYGTTFSFTPAGGVKTAVGRLSAVGELTADSEVLDVTTLDSTGGWRESMQGFRDAGELSLKGYHDQSDAGQAALRAAYLTGAAGEAEIAFPDGCAVRFNAFVKSHSLGAAEVDGAIGFGAVLRVSGAVAVSAAND